MRIMKSHVNDLSEQNEVLVAIVEDVEKEANDRVASLEDKLQKSAADTKVSRRYLTLERYLVLANTAATMSFFVWRILRLDTSKWFNFMLLDTSKAMMTKAREVERELLAAQIEKQRLENSLQVTTKLRVLHTYLNLFISFYA